MSLRILLSPKIPYAKPKGFCLRQQVLSALGENFNYHNNASVVKTYDGEGWIVSVALPVMREDVVIQFAQLEQEAQQERENALSLLEQEVRNAFNQTMSDSGKGERINADGTYTYIHTYTTGGGMCGSPEVHNDPIVTSNVETFRSKLDSGSRNLFDQLMTEKASAIINIENAIEDVLVQLSNQEAEELNNVANAENLLRQTLFHEQLLGQVETEGAGESA